MDIEIKSLIEDGNKAVVALRDAVESKADAGTVARIEADLAKALEAKSALESRLAAVETAAARPGAIKGAEAVDEHKAAFIDYMRKSNDRGIEQKLQEVEAKNFVGAAPSNGGFAVPTAIATEIARVAVNHSPLRRLVRSVTASTPNYTEILSNANAGTGWVGEEGTRTETSAPTLSRVQPTFGEVYAVAEVSNHMLQDVFFNLEAWLVAEIAEKFAAAEGLAFLTGNGTDKPTGILNGSTVSTIASGAAAAFGANPFDNLIDLRYAIKGEYAQNGTFLMNSGVLAQLAKVKDSNGNYIYQPAIAAGVAETLMGKAVAIDENMPSVAANAKPVLFGDFARGYVAVDLVGTSLIIDNVTNKGFTQFYLSKRVGGAVKDAAALKALEIKA